MKLRPLAKRRKRILFAARIWPRRYAVEDIARWFGVPVEMLGMTR